jgi:hypothetical protein
MKLYTEKQLERAMDLYKRNVSKNRIVKSLTPIELPSDEDIHIEAKIKKDNIKKLLFDRASFEFGAMWMRDKIGGDNEQQ